MVEIAPQVDPPVCRIMDFGKYRYEQEQKAKRAKKHQAMVVVKEIKMRPKIDHHDFEIKEAHVKKFLSKGAKVKVTMMFRGREMAHTDIGRELLGKLAQEVKDFGDVEQAPKIDGRNMIMTIAPHLHHHSHLEEKKEQTSENVKGEKRDAESQDT